MRTLVTGNAGFIGFHVASRLLRRGDAVVGVDVVNDYYSPDIKESRLTLLQQFASEAGAKYSFHRANLADPEAVKNCFSDGPFDRVIHLAAQAGVRYSLENPGAYVESNIVAFTNILEACRHSNVKHLTYASTSSVYGANTRMPFSEHQGVDHPLQFYAATKRANELMAHSYSHLFRLPTSGLRFFTVYGPWGRPDMAYYSFCRNILEGKEIQIFNHGDQVRDFTYIDDIVNGTILAAEKIDDATAVSDHHILEQGYAAGEGIDLQFDGVYANAVGQSRCLEIHRRFQARCDPRRDLVAGRSRQRICYFAQGDGNIFAMFHDDPVANIQILLRNPEHESCGRDRLFTHGASCQVNGASRGDSLAAGKTAETEVYCGSIAADHGYVFRPDADLIGGDLCENRLEALPHCHCSGDDRDLPGATNANNGRLERAAPGAFHVVASPMPSRRPSRNAASRRAGKSDQPAAASTRRWHSG